MHSHATSNTITFGVCTDVRAYMCFVWGSISAFLALLLLRRSNDRSTIDERSTHTHTLSLSHTVNKNLVKSPQIMFDAHFNLLTNAMPFSRLTSGFDVSVIQVEWSICYPSIPFTLLA